jgi:AraC family transcriptional regulator, regulatory protein of adaptative response / DNA-3-methyladenine glycosylase II
MRFSLAATAEAAGYRACHRCRPYRSVGPLVWEQPELVCRAVRLILDGALDGSSEAELGARLGISSRHLRRLFGEHLGVTPDGLARSARTHFARRLLDDTDLSMSEVALAAGFGSLRQFNRACREIFHDSPARLRARRRKRDRLVADGGLPLRLAYAGVLDWHWLLRVLAAHAIPGVEAVSGEVYRRTIVIDGDPGVLELSPLGDGELRLLAHLPHWEGLVHLVARARRIASLDLDLDAATSALRGDPQLAGPMRARPGRRPAGTWDGFEAGVQLIVAEQVPGPPAREALARLVERLGRPAPGLELLGLTHTFPDAVAVAGADLAMLCSIPPGCADAVRAFAGAIVGGVVRLDGSMPLADLVGSLVGLERISVRTANALAVRLGEADAYPETSRAALERAERWRPWRALAATYLAGNLERAA